MVFPCLRKELEQLKMPKDQKALLIFHVFKGQTTQQVKDVILEITASVYLCRKTSQTQASYGKGPDYFLLKTAIFRISVFPLLFSMEFGTELNNDQYGSFK